MVVVAASPPLVHRDALVGQPSLPGFFNPDKICGNRGLWTTDPRAVEKGSAPGEESGTRRADSRGVRLGSCILQLGCVGADVASASIVHEGLRIAGPFVLSRHARRATTDQGCPGVRSSSTNRSDALRRRHPTEHQQEVLHLTREMTR